MYQDGYLSSTELTALRKTCRDLRENAVRVLRSLNIVSQPEIQGLLQRFYGHDSATDALIENIGEDQRNLLPIDIALHYSVVAIGMHDRRLLVLMEDPTERRILESLGFFMGLRVRPVVATATQLARALSRAYGVEVGDLRLTTVLEASRGVFGGVIYDHSQIAGAPEAEDDYLVDRGARMDRLGALQDVRFHSSQLPDVTPVAQTQGGFGDDSGSEALSARLSLDLVSDLGAEVPLAREPAKATTSAEVQPAPTRIQKSVFDDFEGIEHVDDLEPELAAANVPALEALAFNSDASGDHAELGDLAPDVPGSDADDGLLGSDAESLFASEPDDDFKELDADPVVDPVDTLDSVDTVDTFETVETSAVAVDGFDVPEESAPEQVPLAPALLSRALLKATVARGREGALSNVNALLGEAGLTLSTGEDGVSLMLVAPAGEWSLSDGGAELPTGFEPLRPLLKQIFRLPSSS